MKGVDDLMATCPLKHEIRVSFWEPYIKKLGTKPISYLTLYSPPLMDVKYLHSIGLIDADEVSYTNVVGVGINIDSEADTTANLDKRLSLLLSGDINTLITDGANKSLKVKQLEEKFPFDVINLDYTDTLHNYSRKEELSPHIKAIETILSRQEKGNKNDFILFVTTNASLSDYNPEFIEHLKSLITKNIAETPGFAERLQKITDCSNVKDYFNSFQNDCFAVSLVKYLLSFLSDHNYTIADGDIKWLVRDESKHVANMLHLGFHIKRFTPPAVKTKAAVGKRKNNVESKAVDFIKKKYHVLSETIDKQRLNAKHLAQINKFNQRTFELDVPKPKDE